MKQFLLPILILCCFTFTIKAQNPGKKNNTGSDTGNKEYLLRFELSAEIPPANAYGLDVESLKTSFFREYAFLLVQFEELPSEERKRELKDSGIELLRYFSSKAYYAKVSENTLHKWSADKAKRFGLRSFFVLKPEHKINPELLAKDFPDWASNKGGLALRIRAFEALSTEGLRERLLPYGGQVMNEAFFGSAEIQIPETGLDKLLQAPWLMNAELGNRPKEEINTPGRQVHRSHAISTTGFTGAFGLKGEGIRVGEWDGGSVPNLVDFTARHTQKDAATPNNHATHVAGTIAGGGIAFPFAAGMAPRATLYTWAWDNAFAEMAAAMTTPADEFEITSNSWGFSFSCGTSGDYIDASAFIDDLCRTHDRLSVLFAAGNSRSGNCVSGGYETLIQGAQVSKNAVIVGAVNRNDNLASFSSCGPTTDGRIKPDVVGVGVSVFSNLTSGAYGNMSGTSMATPGVSGTLAQLYEWYFNTHASYPTGILMKAVLLNNAEDLGHPGPDYRFGFGRINGWRSAKTLEENRYLENTLSDGGLFTHTVTVPAGAHKLDVLITWDDPAASPSAAATLINNLDLTVEDPLGNISEPWVLDPSNPNDDALTGTDNLNNVEQITINTPIPGVYTIRVNGTAIPDGPQDFALTWTVNEPHIKIMHPNGGEHLRADHEHFIVWDALGVNTDQTIEYSLDNGATWTIIATVGADVRRRAWTTPDVMTSEALIRITSGSLSDVSDGTFHIMRMATGITTSSACGELTMNWTAAAGATDYDVFLLNTSTGAYDLIANTSATTYTITGLAPGGYWVSLRSRDAVSGAVSERNNGFRRVVTTSPDDVRLLAIENPDCDFTLPDETVTLRIRNEGCTIIPSGQTIDLSYRLGGGSTVTETLTLAADFNPADELAFNFISPVPLPVAGTYSLDAWLNYGADINTANDTLSNYTFTGPVDLELASIESPECEAVLGAKTVSVRIKNVGCQAVPSGTIIPVSYTFDGGLPVTEMLSLGADFNPGDERLYNFTTPLNLAATGIYPLEAEVNYVLDGGSGNNIFSGHKVVAVNPAIPYFEDFENPNPAPCWTYQIDGSGPGWGFDTGAEGGGFSYPDNGSGQYATVNDDNCGDPGCGDPSDDWFISPRFDFTTCSGYEVRFDAVFESSAGFPNDAFMKVSTDMISWTTVYTFSSDPDTWQDITVDLSAFAGEPQVWIAFHYDDLGSWAYGLVIDNFHLYEKSFNLVSLSPADGTTDIPVSDNLVLEFDIPPVLGSGGSITIDDGISPVVINIPDPQVSIVGNTLVIDPVADLDFDQLYEITLSSDVLTTACASPWIGVLPGEWTFTTEKDMIDPVISCPADIALANDVGLCGAVVTYTAPVGTDNLPGAVTTQTGGLGSGSVFPVGTTTETYTVTDLAGNTSTCSFTVTVTDDEAPVFTCTPNINVLIPSFMADTALVYTIPPAGDNCGAPTVWLESGLGSGADFSVGTHEEVYVAQDAAGNTDTCRINIEVSQFTSTVYNLSPLNWIEVQGLSTSEMSVKWYDTETEEDAYELYRAEENGDFLKIADLPPSNGETVFEDSGLKPDTRYSYFVKVLKAGSPPKSSDVDSDYTYPLQPTINKITDACFGEAGSVFVSGSHQSGLYFWYEAEESTERIRKADGSELFTEDFRTEKLLTEKTYYVSAKGRGYESSPRLAVTVGVLPVPNTEIVGASERRLCGELSVLEADTSTEDEIYHWYRNDKLIQSGEEPFLMINQPGLYGLRAESVAGCVGLISEVWVLSKPEAPEIVQGKALRFCEETVLQAKEETDASFEWYREGELLGTGNSLSINESGIYRLVKEQYGCLNETEITADRYPMPEHIALTGTASEFCKGESVTLSTVPVEGANYRWFRNGRPIPGGRSNEVSVSKPGDYRLEMTFSTSCTKLSEVYSLVRHEPETLSFAEQEPNVLELLLNGSPDFEIAEIRWYLNGEEITDKQGLRVVTLTEEGVYYAESTDTHGCLVQSPTFRFFGGVRVTAVESPEDQIQNLALFPNPTQNRVTLRFSGFTPGEFTLTLTDDLGRELIQSTLYTNENGEHILDLDSYASGVYFLKIRTTGFFAVRKIVKRD